MTSKSGWYNDWEAEQDEKQESICNLNASKPAPVSINPWSNCTLSELKIQMNLIITEIARRKHGGGVEGVQNVSK